MLLAPCLLWAQSQPPAKPGPRTVPSAPAATRSRPTPLLLDSNDGLAILGAALEGRHRAEDHSDCSHLVHEIYEKAGFPYKYMRSADLYAGIEEFRRVTRPQVGDLVVWPGHAGIIVNPAQHTFYSALRSGFGVQLYDSSYWRGRGHPRFYRYVKHPPAPVLSASSHPASLKTVDLRNDGAVKEVPSKATSGASLQADSVEAVDPPPFIPLVPTVLMVRSFRPKVEVVRAAVLEQIRETGESLETQDVLKLDPVVVAFDRLEIQKVHLTGDRGWAEVRISEPLIIASRTPAASKLGGTQRWNLRRRGSDSWELALPRDAIYIPREVAVRLLAHQLAALTDAHSPGQSDRKVQLARLLNVLLETH